MIGLGIVLNYWNKEMKSGEYKIVLLADRYMKIVQETRNWWKGYQQDCIASATKELEKKNDNKKGLYKNK